MKVKVFPYVKGKNTGNIIWEGKYQMKNGKFPSNHPVGGIFGGDDGQIGNGKNIEAFRARGYWASCFPEGDGITWIPEKGQTIEQTIIDIKECFGWELEA